MRQIKLPNSETKQPELNEASTLSGYFGPLDERLGQGQDKPRPSALMHVQHLGQRHSGHFCSFNFITLLFMSTTKRIITIFSSTVARTHRNLFVVLYIDFCF